ncbi:DUF4238 domain-containing protein [Peribacillus glennii]|uniref:DUF4238 domain-containing protein n=1 Tax=Peribacillus glennii TaxID=2303991 RepID=UPI0026BDE950|nr:DUF4238 domain-containing protein [Peribacillus glennii]
MVDFMTKTIMKEHPDFKDVDLEPFTIGWNEPANHMIEMALESIPMVIDLEPILIVEQKGARRFITSDNPVVRYNSFYISKRYPRGFSYITRGLQLFLPISPHKCIMLYDRLAYDIPEAKKSVNLTES